MTENEYLNKKERTYPVAKFINENLPLNSLLIVAGEPRVFYFDRRTISYKIWQRTRKESINSYIREQKSKGLPVYLLYREGTFLKSIESIISGKTPIYRAIRAYAEGEVAKYYIYSL